MLRSTKNRHHHTNRKDKNPPNTQSMRMMRSAVMFCSAFVACSAFCELGAKFSKAPHPFFFGKSSIVFVQCSFARPFLPFRFRAPKTPCLFSPFCSPLLCAGFLPSLPWPFFQQPSSNSFLPHQRRTPLFFSPSVQRVCRFPTCPSVATFLSEQLQQRAAALNSNANRTTAPTNPTTTALPSPSLDSTPLAQIAKQTQTCKKRKQSAALAASTLLFTLMRLQAAMKTLAITRQCLVCVCVSALNKLQANADLWLPFLAHSHRYTPTPTHVHTTLLTPFVVVALFVCLFVCLFPFLADCSSCHNGSCAPACPRNRWQVPWHQEDE